MIESAEVMRIKLAVAEAADYAFLPKRRIFFGSSLGPEIRFELKDFYDPAYSVFSLVLTAIFIRSHQRTEGGRVLTATLTLETRFVLRGESVVVEKLMNDATAGSHVLCSEKGHVSWKEAFISFRDEAIQALLSSK